MSANRLNICIEPEAYVFYKNIHSIFIGCNNAFAELCGFQQPADVIGKSDYDLPWGNAEASLYRERDQSVLDGVILTNYIESQSLANGKKTHVLINKIPLINTKGQKIGIAGSYVHIVDQCTHSIKSTASKNIALSERQLECLVFLAKGLTAKKIGSHMQITEKTVQSHIDKLKEKLCCHTKQELIETAWQSELVRIKLFAAEGQKDILWPVA